LVQTNRSLRFHRVPNHDNYTRSWVSFLLSLQKFLLATSWGGVSFCGAESQGDEYKHGYKALRFCVRRRYVKGVQTQEPLNKHFRFGGADWRVFFLAAHATRFLQQFFDIDLPATSCNKRGTSAEVSIRECNTVKRGGSLVQWMAVQYT